MTQTKKTCSKATIKYPNSEIITLPFCLYRWLWIDLYHIAQIILTADFEFAVAGWD